MPHPMADIPTCLCMYGAPRLCWPYAVYEDPYDIANAYSYYERIFFPVSIDGAHPVTVSSFVPDGTPLPNAANAIAYIKQRILATGSVPGASHGK